MNDSNKRIVRRLWSSWPNVLRLEISADVIWEMIDSHQSSVKRLWSLGPKGHHLEISADVR